MQAFSDLYKWICFGLHLLMTNLFKSQTSKILRGEKPSPYAIKFMFATEKALAFTVGSNSRTLSCDSLYIMGDH